VPTARRRQPEQELQRAVWQHIRRASPRTPSRGTRRTARSETASPQRSSRAWAEAELAEVARDPVRLRAYFWCVAMSARRKATRQRSRHLMAFSEHILDNLDALVETTLEKREGYSPTYGFTKVAIASSDPPIFAGDIARRGRARP
jgi:hypothetical protein